MGQVLIWVLVLVTLLLFYAAMVATAYRRQGRAVRVTLLVIGWAVPLLLLMAAAVGPVLFAVFMPIYQWLAWFGVALLVAFVVGVLLIRRRAKREPADEWPAGRLWLACAVSAALFATTVWNLDLQSRLRIQAYRAEAGILLLSVAPPQVNESENAALVYEQAFALMKEDPAFADAMDAVDSGEATKLLQRHTTTLELIRRAADMPRYRPDHDYARPSIEMMLPQLSEMRSAARLLAAAAREEADAGDFTSAIRDVNRLFRMGDQVGTSPILVSNLTGMGIAGLANRVLADLLPKVTSAEQLETVEFTTPSAWHRRATRALRGEFAFGIATMCDMVTGDFRFPNSDLSASSFPAVGMPMRLFMFEPDMQSYQQSMRAVSEAAADPDRTLSDVRALLPKVDKAKQGLFTSILFPSLERYLVVVARAQAMDQMSRVAIAATRYRLDHGAYPDSVDQLVPKYIAAMPLDPEDDQPIRMVLRDEGLVIYSVGDDRKDDGGEVDDDLHPEGKRPRDFGLILRTKPKPPVIEAE